MTVFIKTPRLVLRTLNVKDAPSMFLYRSLPAIYRYQSFKPNTIKEVEHFITENTQYFNKEGTWHQLAIELEERLIGDIGLHFIGPMNLHCEIGYTVDPHFQHKGYGREAVGYVLKYLFEERKKHKVIASVDPENIPSIKLLEDLGFKREGILRKSIYEEKEWKDDLVYGMLEEEWEKIRLTKAAT